MSDPLRERPCIHIALAADADAVLVRALEIGAEEEGVPCRLVPVGAAAALQAAHEAASSSRFGIGLGLDRSAIVLHEMHMPAAQPVLRFELGGAAVAACRVMGANAARLLVGRPLHLNPVPMAEAAVVVPAPALVSVASSGPGADVDLDPTALARVVAAVVAKLRERGIR